MKAAASALVGAALGISVLLWFLPHGDKPPASEQQGAPTGETLARFEARDIIGFDWPRTLVTYRVQFKPGQAFARYVRLVDDGDKEQACQLWRATKHGDGSIASARVSFRTELKAGGQYRYRLMAEEPAPAADAPTATEQGEYLTLDNRVVALRLPRAGRQRFAKPLAWSSDHAAAVQAYEAPAARSLIPGPIQGVRLADGRWVGGSYFRGTDPTQAPKAVGYHCTVTEQGPLFAEARVRYEFDNGGSYELTARVLAGDPAVRIDEQADLKQIGRADTCELVTSLSSGWKPDGWRPDRVFWGSQPPLTLPPLPSGERVRGEGEDPVLEKTLGQLGFGRHPKQRWHIGIRPLLYDAPASKLFDLTVWNPWTNAAYYCGLVDSRSLTQEAVRKQTVPFLAVVPLHVGSWRNNQEGCKTLTTHKAGDVAIHWPLLAPPHPSSYLHTGEYDPELPATFTRRLWALVGGPFQYHGTLFAFRAHEGNVNLDNYKDWVLDWPEDTKVPRPCLALKKQDVERLAGRLTGHPAADVLNGFTYFRDDPQRRRFLYLSSTNDSEWSGPRAQCLSYLQGRFAEAFPWHSLYRQTQMAASVFGLDEALSGPGLSADERRNARAWLAALCHLMAEPDFNPRGSMDHLGNPNMPINRFFALTFAAAVIPDHPRAKEWLDVSAEYVRYKLAMNEAPGGAWSELLSYLMPGMHTVQAALALGDRLDDATRRRAALPARFALQLLAPYDPRFGARSLPNWGHEGCYALSHWLVAAALVRERHPELASALVWAWDQLGRPLNDHHDCGFSPRLSGHADLLAVLKPGYTPLEMRSAWLPGFGAVLRAHAGDPNETFLAYRQGYLTSHCDANQGDFVLHAKGAPLSTLSLGAYAIHNDSPFAKLNGTFGWHNRVRFGSQADTGGWPGGGPISQVHAHSFGDSVDYLRGLGDYGPQRWSRHIIFLKGKTAGGPNYFVCRDSFEPTAGADQLQPKWWYLRTPGEKKQVRPAANGLSYASAVGAKLDVRFLQPSTVALETRDANWGAAIYGQAALNWNRAHQTGPPRAAPLAENIPLASGGAAETISVTAAGPIAPGQDVLVALYPQTEKESAPTYEALADGAAKITTTEGTDYVFVHHRPMKFTQGDVAFAGIAGAVRVYPSEVRLVIAEGPGRVSYQGTVLESSVPATRVIPTAGLNEAKTIRVPPPATAIRFDLDPAHGPITEVAPGVHRQSRPDGFAIEFRSAEPLAYEKDGVVFRGRRGGIEVDERGGTARLVMLDGDKIGRGDAQAWGCDGPYDLTFSRDAVVGKTDGQGRHVYLRKPAGLNQRPQLDVDGEPYLPGEAPGVLIVPLMPGAHAIEVRALRQPPVFRSWQMW